MFVWCVLRSLASTTIICLNICCLCFFSWVILSLSLLDSFSRIFFGRFFSTPKKKRIYVMIQYYEYDLRSTRLLLSSVKLFQPVAITSGSHHGIPQLYQCLRVFVSCSHFVYYLIFYISLSTFQWRQPRRQRIKSNSAHWKNERMKNRENKRKEK